MPPSDGGPALTATSSAEGTRSLLGLLSLIFLSAGVLDRFGETSSTALLCVVISVCFGLLVLTGIRVGLPVPASLPAVGLPVLLAAAGVLNNGKFATSVFFATFAVTAVAILVHTLLRRQLATVLAFGLAAGATLVGIEANLRWGYAHIDVFRFQQSAAEALLHGGNPYTPLTPAFILFPSGATGTTPLHFPYGPIFPVLEAPFRLLGDIRVLHMLAAVVTAGAVLLLARRAGTFNRAAAVVMAFPLTVGMVVSSWVDIITMAALATWFVLLRSHPRVAVCALFVVFAAKPTTLVALAPIAFWSERARRQMVTAAAIAVPFVLVFAIATGFSQFYFDVLGVQLKLPPRFDALTVNSYLHALGLPLLPVAVSVIAVALVTLLVLTRRPESYGELLTGSAIIATVAFLVAKWAFFNYYYIPAVLLMLAIAGDRLPLDSPDMIHPPRALEWLGRRALAVIGRGSERGTAVRA